MKLKFKVLGKEAIDQKTGKSRESLWVRIRLANLFTG